MSTNENTCTPKSIAFPTLKLIWHTIVHMHIKKRKKRTPKFDSTSLLHPMYYIVLLYSQHLYSDIISQASHSDSLPNLFIIIVYFISQDPN